MYTVLLMAMIVSPNASQTCNNQACNSKVTVVQITYSVQASCSAQGKSLFAKHHERVQARRDARHNHSASSCSASSCSSSASSCSAPKMYIAPKQVTNQKR